MIGVLSGNVLFSAFVDDQNPQSTAWLTVYYVLAGLAALAFVLLSSTPLDESKVSHDATKSFADDLGDMIRLVGRPVVLIFVISAFVYVLLEQGIMSWLPTFNNKILKLPTSLSLQMASILAVSTALGRFLAGFLLRKISWYWLLMGCLVLAAGLVLIALPLASSVNSEAVMGWGNAPLAAFISP